MEYQLTEKEFLTIYNMYKPNKFLIFISKYFSTDGFFAKVIMVLYFIIMNTITIIINENNPESLYFKPMVIISNLPLVIWGLIILVAFIINTKRHKKIMKKLNIKTVEEYNRYINLYVKK